MKFKFCSDGDCPLWALAGLHALSTLPAPLFRRLLDVVTDGQNDDEIMDVLKETNLSSRDEAARAAAVIRWCLRQAWSCSCPGSQLARDLLVLGVPRTHASAMADVLDAGAKDYVERHRASGGFLNLITDASISPGPESTVDTLKLTLDTNDVTGDQRQQVLLIDKAQATCLLQELKAAYKKIVEIEEAL